MQLQVLISELTTALKYNYCNRKLFLESSGFVYFKTNTCSCLLFSASHWENKPERERTWKVTSCFDVGFHHSILTKYLIGNMLFETICEQWKYLLGILCQRKQTDQMLLTSAGIFTQKSWNTWGAQALFNNSLTLTYKRGIGIRENMSSDRSRKAWRGIPRKIGLAYLNAPSLFRMAPAHYWIWIDFQVFQQTWFCNDIVLAVLFGVNVKNSFCSLRLRLWNSFSRNTIASSDPSFTAVDRRLEPKINFLPNLGELRNYTFHILYLFWPWNCLCIILKIYICLIFHVTHSKMSHFLSHSETAPGTKT